MFNHRFLKMIFALLFLQVLIISCEKKTHVNKGTSSDQYDSEWQKGKDLFVPTCGICHLTVKKDEIFKRYISSLTELNADQRIEHLRTLLAGEKHRFVKDDRYSTEELKAIAKFIITPQRTH